MEIVLDIVYGTIRDGKVQFSFEDFSVCLQGGLGANLEDDLEGDLEDNFQRLIDMNGGGFAAATGKKAWWKLTIMFKVLALLNSYLVSGLEVTLLVASTRLNRRRGHAV